MRRGDLDIATAAVNGIASGLESLEYTVLNSVIPVTEKLAQTAWDAKRMFEKYENDTRV